MLIKIEQSLRTHYLKKLCKHIYIVNTKLFYYTESLLFDFGVPFSVTTSTDLKAIKLKNFIHFSVQHFLTIQGNYHLRFIILFTIVFLHEFTKNKEKTFSHTLTFLYSV